MTNKTISVLFIALLFISAASAQFRTNSSSSTESKSLNDTVKAVLGSIFDSLNRGETDDSSDDLSMFGNVTSLRNNLTAQRSVSDDSDEVYDLSGLFAEPEYDQYYANYTADSNKNEIQELFQELFGNDTKLLNDLVEMVAVTIEDMFDRASYFGNMIDPVNMHNQTDSVNMHNQTGNYNMYTQTESVNFDNQIDEVNLHNQTDSVNLHNKTSLVNMFGSVDGLITDMVAKFLNGTTQIVETQYIVSDPKINLPLLEIPEEQSENDGDLKDPIATISFIKTQLGRKVQEKHSKEGHVKSGDKVLRRQNAMKQKDFEKYLREDKENNEIKTVVA